MSIAEVEWNGPSPLLETDTLCGREVELTKLISQFDYSLVVTLTAKSGFGKTSFMRAGLLPRLETQGLRDKTKVSAGWPDAIRRVTARLDPEAEPDAIAEALYADVLCPEDPDRYRDHLGAVGFVILDQFEEVLRYRPEVGTALLELAGRTARDDKLPHLVIARSEYADDLRAVETRNLPTFRMSLKEIVEEDKLTQIAVSPAESKGVEFTESATSTLYGWWRAARSASDDSRARMLGAGGSANIGLLHFQALLWNFGQWAKREHGDATVVDDALLEKYASVQELQGEDVGPELVRLALSAYVREKTTELGSSHASDFWPGGPMIMFARVAAAFSVGGYKQPQTLQALLQRALAQELGGDQIISNEERFKRAVEERLVGAGLAWELKGEPVKEHMRGALRQALEHASSDDVNILRRYEGDSNEEGDARTVFELVHDGMGVALNDWAQELLGRPSSTYGAIAQRTAPELDAVDLDGQAFAELSADDQALYGFAEDQGGVTVLTALRWPSAAIKKVKLRKVTFRGCDFTGASFLECDLTEVTFEGCTLKATAFIACDLQDVSFVEGDASATRFLPPSSRDDPDRFGLLTIKAGKQASPTIAFSGLADTTGLFIENLPAGASVIFRDSTVRHLVLRDCGGVTVDVEESRLMPYSTFGEQAPTVRTIGGSVAMRVDVDAQTQKQASGS